MSGRQIKQAALNRINRANAAAREKAKEDAEMQKEFEELYGEKEPEKDNRVFIGGRNNQFIYS